MLANLAHYGWGQPAQWAEKRFFTVLAVEPEGRHDRREGTISAGPTALRAAAT